VLLFPSRGYFMLRKHFWQSNWGGPNWSICKKYRVTQSSKGTNMPTRSKRAGDKQSPRISLCQGLSLGRGGKHFRREKVDYTLEDDEAFPKCETKQHTLHASWKIGLRLVVRRANNKEWVLRLTKALSIKLKTPGDDLNLRCAEGWEIKIGGKLRMPTSGLGQGGGGKKIGGNKMRVW